MLIRVNAFMRHQRRLLALIAVSLLVMALLATHNVATADHHAEKHHGMGVQSVLMLCMAVIETGIALSLVVRLVATRERPAEAGVRPTGILARPRPAIAGVGPPGPRLTLLQVSLR